MTAVQFNLGLGYTVIPETHKSTIFDAGDIFLTRKQKKITMAERKGANIEYTTHYIKCPFCEHKVHAYGREFGKAFGYVCFPSERVSKEIVNDWLSQQTSIFDNERKPLYFNRVMDVDEKLTCPKCKNTLERSDKTRFVEIVHDNHEISIRAEVLNIKELFSIPCLNNVEIRVGFPLYEVATFNFENGHSYIELLSKDGDKLAREDLTAEKKAWASGAVYNAVTKNPRVRRTLRNMFNEEWQGNMPFVPSELSINDMRMLTMFQGYDRAFYSSIPFRQGSFNIDESFAEQAVKMRKAKDIELMYSESKLPAMKSVRKLFFKNAGLFFYIEECERLWEIFKDPNYFVDLLSESVIYQVLSDLHMRPMAFDFISDYLKTGRTRHLLELIHKYWHEVYRYAVNYGSMSNYMRESEKLKWQKRERVSKIGDKPNFAIPMCKPNERIRNCTIDEFEFSWLKTSTDYDEVGKALHNCLKQWTAKDYPVVSVRKNGKIIAALEIRDDFVYQARTANNRSLRQISGLTEAFYRWHEKNNLSNEYKGRIREADDENFFFDDEEDLPF